MIENLKDELSQLQNKHAKVLNFVLEHQMGARAQKMLQNFLQIERQNMQNQAIFELYILMM